MILTRIRTVWQDRAGAALVELALALPLLLSLFVGGMEIGRYTLLHMKLNYTANSVADLVTRSATITQDDIDNVFAAVAPIFDPFAMGSNGRVIITAVGGDGTSSPDILWQAEGAGTLSATSEIGNEGGTATLPANFELDDGEVVIVSEVFFEYEEWLLGIVPDNSLRKVSFFRPRLGGLVNVPASP